MSVLAAVVGAAAAAAVVGFVAIDAEVAVVALSPLGWMPWVTKCALET